MSTTGLDNLPLLLSGVFGLALALCAGLLALILRLPVSRLFQDPPGKRKIHQRIVPRAGGLCLVASFLVLMYAVRAFVGGSLFLEPFWDALIFATAAILVIGTLDDTYVLHIDNRAKLILEILIAVEVVFLMRLRFTDVNIFGASVNLGWLGAPLTILWLVGVTNAFNIIDGIDGLAGSLVLTGVVALGVLGHGAGAVNVVIICAIVAGAVTGFLMHNLPPARIFLGDTGSLFLGMTVGILSIQIASVPVHHSRYPLISAFLVAGFPVLDVFAAMVRRYTRALASGMGWGQALGSMMVPDSDHIHHRLTHRGLAHGETTLFLFLFGSLFTAGAVVIARMPSLPGWGVLLYLALVALWLLSRLSFLDRIHEVIVSQYSHPALNRRYAVGVVHADEILHHALSMFAQNEFDFLFLTREQIAASVFNHAAIIAVNTNASLYEDDMDFAGRMARLHKCPVIFISDKEREEPEPGNVEEFDIIHTGRPVYIPALLNLVLTAVRSRATETPAGRRQVNVALQPMAGGNNDAARFSKR